MTEPHDTPSLDDVMTPAEDPIRDRREHAKMPKHVNDEELHRRVEAERVELGLEDYDPDSVPPAT